MGVIVWSGEQKPRREDPYVSKLMIRKAAIATGDSKVIGLSSRDLLAADSWYHEGQFFRVSKGFSKNK